MLLLEPEETFPRINPTKQEHVEAGLIRPPFYVLLSIIIHQFFSCESHFTWKWNKIWSVPTPSSPPRHLPLSRQLLLRLPSGEMTTAYQPLARHTSDVCVCVCVCLCAWNTMSIVIKSEDAHNWQIHTLAPVSQEDIQVPKHLSLV